MRDKLRPTMVALPSSLVTYQCSASATFAAVTGSPFENVTLGRSVKC
jgi:hypothetical protein